MLRLNRELANSLGIFFLGCLALTATAADFTAVSGEGGTVYFDISPEISYGSADLRVSSPHNIVSQQIFDPGFVPYYPPANTRLADGVYVFRLELNPIVTENAKKQWAAARRARNETKMRTMINELRADGELPETLVQSGSFWIQNGVVLPPQSE